MKALSRKQKEQLRQRYASDGEVLNVLKTLDAADRLLEKALWEFGSELRRDIEGYLGEQPLIGQP